MLVVCAVLAVLSWSHGRADAATPDPAVHCGDSVRWELDASLVGTPADAEVAIRAAWAQVAPVARLVPTEVDQSADIAWAWPDTGMGEDLPDQQAWDTTLFGGHRYWSITHSASTSDAGGKALRQLVLRDVLTALGVSDPSSGAVLNSRDRRALNTVCRTEAAAAASPAPSVSASPSAPTTASGVPDASQSRAVIVGSPATHTASWSGAWGAAHHAAVLVAVVLGALLASWWATGPQLARAVTALRRRGDGDGDGQAEDDQDDQGNPLTRFLTEVRRVTRRRRNAPSSEGDA